MMAKDSVKNRLEDGMSFTEFSYQLVQGYDFYHLWKGQMIIKATPQKLSSIYNNYQIIALYLHNRFYS